MERDELTPTPDDLDFKGVTSRYADIEGVRIDPAKVPERFRHLIDLAKHWAIGDDVEAADMMWLTPHEELRTFVNAVAPLANEIEDWCQQHSDDIPVPDEAVLFEMMLDVFGGAEAGHVSDDE